MMRMTRRLSLASAFAVAAVAATVVASTPVRGVPKAPDKKAPLEGEVYYQNNQPNAWFEKDGTVFIPGGAACWGDANKNYYVGCFVEDSKGNDYTLYYDVLGNLANYDFPPNHNGTWQYPGFGKHFAANHQLATDLQTVYKVKIKLVLLRVEVINGMEVSTDIDYDEGWVSIGPKP